MPGAQNIVIIGGGHNGLVAAFYLARAGFKPLVLERRDVAGGAAITEEFYPGFRCSTLAHSSALRPDIVKDMQLEQFDLEMIHPDPCVFAPRLKFSTKDAEKYVEFHDVLGRISCVLGQVLSVTPPSIDHPSAADMWNLLKAGRGFRRLGKKDMFRLLRWAPMAVAHLVAEGFDNELLRATVAA